MGTTIHGYCHDKFERVRDAFAGNFADGSDLGASFAATVDGEYVVDIWAGHLDEEKKTPWKEDTIVNVYSTTKTMAAISALVLADRGEIDLLREGVEVLARVRAERQRRRRSAPLHEPLSRLCRAWTVRSPRPTCTTGTR